LKLLENGIVFIILKTIISLAPTTTPPPPPPLLKDKVFSYRCSLGHPLFRVMKQLFPSFLKNFDVESLCREVCELAKHKRIYFNK